MKSYVVVGLGRFGMQIATRLYEYGEDVLAIDISEDLVNQAADHVTRAAVADAKNKEVLRGLGVQSCDCAIVALGSELSASVLVTMNLKALEVPRIICKAHDDTHSEILYKLGATDVIIPERAVADKLSRSLSSPNVLEYIELSDDYGIVEIAPPRSWVGKTIRDLNIRAKFGVNIIAVKSGESIRVSPSADHKVEGDSVLVLLGDYNSLGKIESIK